MLARLLAFTRGIARRRAIGAECDEELQFHLEQAVEAHVRRGVPPEEARRLALVELGGLTATTEAVRDVRTLRLDRVWQDVRFAVRSLCATPTFTAVAVVILSLSIGASTAIFSIVDAVLFAGLPFDRSEQLFVVGEQNVREGALASAHLTTPQTFLDWRDRQTIFTGLAAVAYGEVSVQGRDDVLPRNLRAQRVTADFFRVLRVVPQLGRAFTVDDEREGGPPVAVISHQLWRDLFGGRGDVVGARLQGQRTSFEVIGVMPDGFSYPIDTYLLGSRESVDVWLPYVFSGSDRVRGADYGDNLHVVGRLREDISAEGALLHMRQVTASLTADAPSWWFEHRVTTVQPLHAFMTRRVRGWMGLLFAAVLCVLLIACVNLASLLLVRATTRGRELAIRAAVGATRWDIARVLLTESLILSLTGAALGVLGAWWGVESLRGLMPQEVPRAATISVNVRVLGITTIAAAAIGLGFGLAPVLQCVGIGGRQGRQQGERLPTAGTRTKKIWAGLVVVEVALAVMLLVGAGLFLASFARVVQVPLGLDINDVHAIRVRVAEIPVDPDRASRRNREALLGVLTRVRALPGVTDAALVGGGLPLRGDLRGVAFGIPGRVLPDADIDLNQVSPEYFDTLRVPVLRGRAFSSADTEGSPPVVILNQAAAAQYFGKDGHGALGQLVRVAGERTVVGIVGDVRQGGPESGSRTQAFVPVAQSRVFGATLVARAPGSRDLMPAIREAVATEFVGLPVRVDEGTLAEYFDRLVARRRFLMWLIGLFGVLGLVIAAAGLYGVMAYTVAQRTREIGLRMALGALPSAIMRSVLAAATACLVVGLALGLTGAFMVARLVRGFLFGTTPTEPMVYAAVVVVLTAVGLAAALVPARRAARVDPIVALRAD